MKRRKSDTGLGRGKEGLPNAIVYAATILFISFFLIVLLSRSAKESRYFRIKDIIIRENNIFADCANTDGNTKLSCDSPVFYLKGKNIFKVDLKKQEASLLRLYPYYKSIRLVRILPNRLFADFITRTPIAYTNLYSRYFYIDEEGAIFRADKEPHELELPLISGLNVKNFTLKQDRTAKTKELLAAVGIINKMKENPSLRDLPIKRIDVRDIVNISFFISIPPLPMAAAEQNTKIPDSLEIKIGSGYIAEKINILSGLLNLSLKNDYNDIEYIDLRFKEPVIKFREKEEKSK